MKKNMKFPIESPKQSRQIQSELLRLGFHWLALGKKRFKHVDKPFLFADWSDMTITWDHDLDNFRSSDSTETTLEELKLM